MKQSSETGKLHVETTSRPVDDEEWNDYVGSQPGGSVYHRSEWREIITSAYGHNFYYLKLVKHLVTKNNSSFSQTNNLQTQPHDHNRVVQNKEIIGILPLIHINHFLFGNSLVSMPFCDAGGILASNSNAEHLLVKHSLQLAESLQAPWVELRQHQPLAYLDNQNFQSYNLVSKQQSQQSISDWLLLTTTGSEKVRMLADLPESSDALMLSFKAKLRSQIRKPIKEDLKTLVGGLELLDDFYNVFVVNMRDLGSPVHSKKFVEMVLLKFPEHARLFIVYRQGAPMACGLTLGFNDVISNLWASSLRCYSHLAPNMLLYWSMLEFGCQNGYKRFDFGRSTPGEGTYRFKEQWGAKPQPLYWYRFSKTNDRSLGKQPEKNKMSKAIEYWKKLPVSVTKVIGPRIRKYISL